MKTLWILLCGLALVGCPATTKPPLSPTLGVNLAEGDVLLVFSPEHAISDSDRELLYSTLLEQETLRGDYSAVLSKGYYHAVLEGISRSIEPPNIPVSELRSTHILLIERDVLLRSLTELGSRTGDDGYAWLRLFIERSIHPDSCFTDRDIVRKGAPYNPYHPTGPPQNFNLEYHWLQAVHHALASGNVCLLDMTTGATVDRVIERPEHNSVFRVYLNDAGEELFRTVDPEFGIEGS